jgi:hypothetical protein
MRARYLDLEPKRTSDPNLNKFEHLNTCHSDEPYSRYTCTDVRHRSDIDIDVDIEIRLNVQGCIQYDLE